MLNLLRKRKKESKSHDRKHNTKNKGENILNDVTRKNDLCIDELIENIKNNNNLPKYNRLKQRLSLVVEAMQYSKTENYKQKLKVERKLDDNCFLEWRLKSIEDEKKDEALFLQNEDVYSFALSRNYLSSATEKSIMNKTQSAINKNESNVKKTNCFIEWFKIQRARGWHQYGNSYFMVLLAGIISVSNILSFTTGIHLFGSKLFFMQYLFIWFVLGIPVFQMEVLLGNLIRGGSIKVCCYFRWWLIGVGICVCYNDFVFVILFARLMITSSVYILNSFNEPLPWDVTEDDKKNCMVFNSNAEECEAAGDNLLCSYIGFDNCVPNLTGKASLFFLTITKPTDLNPFNLNLTSSIISFFVWCIIALYTYWHITSFVCLSAMLLFATLGFFLSLGGMVYSAGGFIHISQLIRFLFKPKWEKFDWGSDDLWLDAVLSIPYDLNLGLGGHTTASSYTKIGFNVLSSSMVALIIDIITRLIAYWVHYSTLHLLSRQTKISVYSLIKKPIGEPVIFTIIPVLFAQCANPNIASFCGFNIICFALLHMTAYNFRNIVSNLEETVFYRRFKFHWICVAFGVTGYLLSIPFCFNYTRYGINFIFWLNYSFVTPIIILTHLLLIGWINGVEEQIKRLGLAPVIVFDVGFFFGVMLKSTWNMYLNPDKKFEDVFLSNIGLGIEVGTTVLSLVISLLLKTRMKLSIKEKLYWLLIGNIELFRKDVNRIIVGNESFFFRLSLFWTICIKFLNTSIMIYIFMIGVNSTIYRVIDDYTFFKENNLPIFFTVAGIGYMVLVLITIILLPFFRGIYHFLLPLPSSIISINELPSRQIIEKENLNFLSYLRFCFLEFSKKNSNIYNIITTNREKKK